MKGGELHSVNITIIAVPRIAINKCFQHFDVFVYILNKGWVQKIERFDWEIPY